MRALAPLPASSRKNEATAFQAVEYSLGLFLVELFGLSAPIWKSGPASTNFRNPLKIRDVKLKSTHRSVKNAASKG